MNWTHRSESVYSRFLLKETGIFQKRTLALQNCEDFAGLVKIVTYDGFRFAISLKE